MNAGDPHETVQSDKTRTVHAVVNRTGDEQVVHAVTDRIAVPARSPVFDTDWRASGWNARALAPCLKDALNSASPLRFGAPLQPCFPAVQMTAAGAWSAV